MSQHDYVIANGTGAAVRSDLNGALGAIVTQNSGSTEPATTYAYMRWADTAAGVMKMRNGANSGWITLYQLDGEWTSIAFENGSAAAPSIYFKDSGTDTGFYSPGADQVGITTGGTVRLTTSTTAFTGTLPWRGQDGTAAAPAISFNSDTDTGIYSIGANQLGIASNGVERANIGTTEVVWNDSGADIDFRVEGDTKANLFKVDAGTDTVSVDGTFATGNVNYPTDGSLSGRNRIINGDMRIDQRNAGASVATAPDATYICDRWRFEGVSGKTTVGRSLNSVTPPAGFSNYAGVQVTSAYTIGASEFQGIGQWIEGFNSADLDLGKSTAAQFTLSFWVRSSVTGTYSVVFFGFDGTNARNYAASYTINAANTWEKKTITVQGDTAATITYNSTNGTGLFVQFTLAAGSSTTTAAGSWGNGFLRGATGTTNLLATNGATFYITGVQLEAGSVATPFERRSYGQELALCQRYFQSSFPAGTAPAKGISGSDIMLSAGSSAFAANRYFGMVYPVVMRASPTHTYYNSINAAAANGTLKGYWGNHSGTTGSGDYTPTFDTISAYSFGGYFQDASAGLGTGMVRFHYTASAEL